MEVVIAEPGSSTPNPARIKLWIEALKSGEFKRGRLGLCLQERGETGTETTYCCLGVACEVFRRETGLGRWGGGGGRRGVRVEYVKFHLAGTHNTTGMPDIVAAWFGLPTTNPILQEESEGQGEVVSCIRANDTEQWSFDKIAEALSRRYT